jgi:hypothetical protein
MKKAAIIFGIASVISLAVSFTEAGSAFGWGLLKPLSAILFGAAFINYLIASEYEGYDREQKDRIESAKRSLPAQPAPTDDHADRDAFIADAARNPRPS